MSQIPTKANANPATAKGRGDPSVKIANTVGIAAPITVETGAANPIFPCESAR